MQPIIRVRLGENRYGIAEPKLEVCYPRAANYRDANAALYRLAAQAELASRDSGAHWVVRTETDYNGAGKITLELVSGGPYEVEQAMTLLKRLARETAPSDPVTLAPPARARGRTLHTPT